MMRAMQPRIVRNVGPFASGTGPTVGGALGRDITCLNDSR